MSMPIAIILRPANAADWPDIEALLLANGLPTAGARDHLANCFVALRDGKVVGCAGAEVYGPIALIRSVAVAVDLRHQGVGRLLVERVLQEARSRDAAAFYLLTTTAAGYFERCGFERIESDRAPQALKASAEFQGACPASAILMRLALIR